MKYNVNKQRIQKKQLIPIQDINTTFAEEHVDDIERHYIS